MISYCTPLFLSRVSRNVMANSEVLSWFVESCGMPTRTKKMFGGIGVFSGDVMFALIHDGVVYLKSTGEMSTEYVDEGYQFDPPFRKGMKILTGTCQRTWIRKGLRVGWQGVRARQGYKEVDCIQGY
jgi:TfoX/Sxy family transcriptional regulator of competence genes